MLDFIFMRIWTNFTTWIWNRIGVNERGLQSGSMGEGYRGARIPPAIPVN